MLGRHAWALAFTMPAWHAFGLEAWANSPPLTSCFASLSLHYINLYYLPALLHCLPASCLMPPHPTTFSFLLYYSCVLHCLSFLYLPPGLENSAWHACLEEGRRRTHTFSPPHLSSLVLLPLYLLSSPLSHCCFRQVMDGTFSLTLPHCLQSLSFYTSNHFSFLEQDKTVDKT